MLPRLRDLERPDEPKPQNMLQLLQPNTTRQKLFHGIISILGWDDYQANSKNLISYSEFQMMIKPGLLLHNSDRISIVCSKPIFDEISNRAL
jgi:hypothetical protein